MGIRRIRFSLRNLLLFLLSAASVGAVWATWAPWGREVTFAAHEGIVCRTACLPNGSLVTYTPGRIRIWDPSTWTLIREMKTLNGHNSQLWVHPRTHQLLTMHSSGEIDEWDPETGKKIRRIADSVPNPGSLCITAPQWAAEDWRLLTIITGGGPIDGIIRVVDYQNGKTIFQRSYIGANERCYSYEITDDGQIILLINGSGNDYSTCNDAYLVGRSLDEGKELWRVENLGFGQVSSRLSMDGLKICVYSQVPEREDFFDVRTGEKVGPSDTRVSTFPKMKSPNGEYFYDHGTFELRRPGDTHYSPSRSPQIRNCHTEGRAVYLARASMEIFDAVFLPDGRLVVGKQNGEVDVWRYRHPEAWWGVFYLPATWSALFFLTLLCWCLIPKAARQD